MMKGYSSDRCDCRVSILAHIWKIGVDGCYVPLRSLQIKDRGLTGPFQRRSEGWEFDHISASILAVVVVAFRVEQKIITGFPCPCLEMMSGNL
jgi:hypothetical protein